MKAVLLITGVLLVLAGAMSFGAESRSTTKPNYDQYKVIYEQNIFSKDRRPPSQIRDPRPRSTRVTQVLSIYVLRGIAGESGRSHQFAFVEEQISGESQMAKIGTPILNGRIVDIQMNYVVFEEDGKPRKIRVGQEFGKTSSTVVKELDGSADTEADSGGTAAAEETTGGATSADEAEILKQLMERRKREMGN